MTDEAYEFHQDVAEKKRIARSAFRKNACGKGAMRFPSDHLSSEERSAMNGECTTYRMNDPMTWKEFKKLPDELKKVYILQVRERFHAKSKDFCELFSCSHYTFDKELARLGVGVGHKMSKTPCDREAFKRWLNRETIEVEEKSGSPAKKPIADNELCAVVKTTAASVSVTDDTLCAEKCENAASLASICGSMSFVGSARTALDTVSELLQDLNCHITITWSTEVD